MNKASFIKQYTMIQKSLAHFQMEDIEQGIFRYALTSTSLPPIRNDKAQQVALILRSYNFDTDIESIITLFELLINPDEKGVKGIVFTPKYIADYIVQTVLSDSADWNPHMTIIDPSCGCGIFMISALEILHKKFHIPFRVLIEKHVFGADIDKTNIRRCTFILKLLAARHGEYITELPHLKHIDSLKENWEQIFGVPNFTYIIGNPPYVNPHDLPQQTADFLKASFQTTRSGTYNIFYAFIEQSMKYLNTCGTLGFIIPNNFLTIKSAHALREYLQKNSYLKKILDFHYNMVFKPTHTYNCLLFLDRKKRQEFNYATMEKTDSIKNSLKSISFHTMSTPLLDKHGWKLTDEKTRKNLHKIEGQFISIKNFIRTGIATLKDSAYMVEHDANGFYKFFNKKKIYIENNLIKPLYKVSDLKNKESLQDIQRYIIFPYQYDKGKYVLIPENKLQALYPKTYFCLQLQKDVLNSRDKGKKNPHGWYAYGRTQGLNAYGAKLLFPTFSSKPKFICVGDKNALFCNGYAIFENEIVDLHILSKILNSSLMNYYIRHTSYAIAGGYYCYQKKYIEKFSLPQFTQDELSYIRNSAQLQINEFLIHRYGLEL